MGVGVVGEHTLAKEDACLGGWVTEIFRSSCLCGVLVVEHSDRAIRCEEGDIDHTVPVEVSQFNQRNCCSGLNNLVLSCSQAILMLRSRSVLDESLDKNSVIRGALVRHGQEEVGHAVAIKVDERI